MSSRSRVTAFVRTFPRRQRWSAALLIAVVPVSALAAQVDIVGPPGSTRFGHQVLALPNGNFAVSDPYNADWSSRPGAVYLYGANGTLISTLTGSDPADAVGAELKSLGNGNFVVLSPHWNHGRGAVTLVNGTTGLSGAVSAGNSLVGSQVGDYVGSSFIDFGFGDRLEFENLVVVGASNYAVASNHWSDGSKLEVGAVTWCSGTTGCAGPVTSANSLIGGTAHDGVGAGMTVLSNGNYVLRSLGWDDPAGARNAGAITWGSGSTGITGLISAANSLVGTQAGDLSSAVIVPLRNGNYVLALPYWNNGAVPGAGAAVWGNGVTGLAGHVSAANALVGTYDFDHVGYSVTALSNGHYVVCSPFLHGGSVEDMGAATWGNGNTGTSGPVGASNSLIGTDSGKGPDHAIALTNGNYVVVSPEWDAGGGANLGAVTWANGNGPTSASVSAANSLVGSSVGDHVGTNVVALSNGNYVVGSPDWDGVAEDTGAATWANGSTGLVGTVSAANSLVGSTQSDGINGDNITALSNGNYVVVSSYWNNGSAMGAGAATWGNGATGIVGMVSAANSLVGANSYDFLGAGDAVALSNGNYVVPAYPANIAGIADTGAVTWGDGSVGTTGAISMSNSLYGGTEGDALGSSGITAMSDGSYVVRSTYWHDDVGAITLGGGSAPLVGPLTAANSVLGTANDLNGMSFDYDPIRHRLVVGRQDSNIVSLFMLDADGIFANGFDG